MIISQPYIVEPTSKMLHNKPQGHWAFGFGEDVPKFWPYIGNSAIMSCDKDHVMIFTLPYLKDVAYQILVQLTMKHNILMTVNHVRSLLKGNMSTFTLGTYL